MSAFARFGQDWARGRGNPKSRLFCALFRLAQASGDAPTPLNTLLAPVRWLYRFVAEGFLGIEIPWRVEIAGGLLIEHGYGLVINSHARLGANVTLRNGVTLGNLRRGEPLAPTVGEGVEFGVGCTVLGPVTVGAGAVIGAGAVVLIDVPAGAVAVGVPAVVRAPRSPAA